MSDQVTIDLLLANAERLTEISVLQKADGGDPAYVEAEAAWRAYDEARGVTYEP